MNSSHSQSALSRLLSLSNRAYDLNVQLQSIRLPSGSLRPDDQTDSSVFTPSPIANLQDDLDRTVRAGLVTCWLADFSELVE